MPEKVHAVFIYSEMISVKKPINTYKYNLKNYIQLLSFNWLWQGFHNNLK